MKIFGLALIFPLIVFSIATAFAQTSSAGTELAPGSAQLITADEMVQLLSGKDKPLVLNVGPSLLFMQAHIPGAEYIGAGSDKQGLGRLRTRVKTLPHDTSIVLYCGC